MGKVRAISPLAEKGFGKGDVFKTDVKTQAVGALEQLQIKVDADNKKWVCNRIEVQQEYRVWQFHCPDIIRGSKPDGVTTLVASGFSDYQLKITSNSITDGVIRAAMFGDMGYTPFFVISFDG